MYVKTLGPGLLAPLIWRRERKGKRASVCILSLGLPQIPRKCVLLTWVLFRPSPEHDYLLFTIYCHFHIRLRLGLPINQSTNQAAYSFADSYFPSSRFTRHGKPTRSSYSSFGGTSRLPWSASSSSRSSSSQTSRSASWSVFTTYFKFT